MKEIGGGAEVRRRMQADINMMSRIMGEGTSQEKREEKNPVITLRNDMWPPNFLSGYKCEIKPCRCEDVSRGFFVAVSFNESIHIVRLLSWKFLKGRINLNFIANYKSRRSTTSSEVRLLGKVVKVTTPSGEVLYPNKINFFYRIFGSITGYGMFGFWYGLYDFLNTLCLDMNLRKKKKQKENSLLENIKALKEWDEKEKLRQEQEAKEAKYKKKHKNEGLEFENTSIYREDKSANDAKAMLSNLSEKDLNSWWAPGEGKR